jgi:hypothetical protein
MHKPAEHPQSDSEGALYSSTPPEAGTCQRASQGVSCASALPNLKGASLERLHEIHFEILGKRSKSSNPVYLRTQIRKAFRGSAPTGTVGRPQSEPAKLVPFRLKVSQINALDEACERLAFSSRADLVRRSLASYLELSGEIELAEIFRG